VKARLERILLGQTELKYTRDSGAVLIAFPHTVKAGTIQTIEGYYLTVALLLQAGSGEITQYSLEEPCQPLGQRLTLLYGLNSPELFDRIMFENFLRIAGLL